MLARGQEVIEGLPGKFVPAIGRVTDVDIEGITPNERRGRAFRARVVLSSELPA
ncbi:hypothetical protein ACI799_07965 [Blastococcus sp. SYSU DS0753]